VSCTQHCQDGHFDNHAQTQLLVQMPPSGSDTQCQKSVTGVRRERYLIPPGPWHIFHLWYRRRLSFCKCVTDFTYPRFRWHHSLLGQRRTCAYKMCVSLSSFSSFGSSMYILFSIRFCPRPDCGDRFQLQRRHLRICRFVRLVQGIHGHNSWTSE
jgi:hypothetical protein